MPSLARFCLLFALLAASHLWIFVQQLWQPRADRSGGPCLSLASLFLFKLTSNLSCSQCRVSSVAASQALFSFKNYFHSKGKALKKCLFLVKFSRLFFFFFPLAARFPCYNNNIIVSTITFEVNVVLLKMNGDVAQRKKRAHRLE